MDCLFDAAATLSLKLKIAQRDGTTICRTKTMIVLIIVPRSFRTRT